MTQICLECAKEFEVYPVIDGIRENLKGRKRCLQCRQIRRLQKPRKAVQRQPRTKICEACGRPFPAKIVIDGRRRSLYRRRFCLACSPFGSHNTSKSPPAIAAPDELREHRRRRRNAKICRCQKRRRKRRKNELVALAGGRCVDCGYFACIAALEFHHRDRSTKEFGLGNFSGSMEKLMTEFAKCDLLCANCHRIRHAVEDDRAEPDRLLYARRELKLRAVAYMGSVCFECERQGPLALFEFHHIDAKAKDFGISRSGIIRAWEKIVAELEKCVMLCANCHREVHAGVRQIRPTPLGLAEEAAIYRAA